MGANTTQPRFKWCVIEVPVSAGGVIYEVMQMREVQGRLPEGRRIIGRADEQRIAEIFATALRREASGKRS